MKEPDVLPKDEYSWGRESFELTLHSLKGNVAHSVKKKNEHISVNAYQGRGDDLGKGTLALQDLTLKVFYLPLKIVSVQISKHSRVDSKDDNNDVDVVGDKGGSRFLPDEEVEKIDVNISKEEDDTHSSTPFLDKKKHALTLKSPFVDFSLSDLKTLLLEFMSLGSQSAGDE
uniref:Uncharacterized protein n=1 Tax=Cannabis sativa TaxID=3483 RepID=A0A803QRI1_CANSA